MSEMKNSTKAIIAIALSYISILIYCYMGILLGKTNIIAIVRLIIAEVFLTIAAIGIAIVCKKISELRFTTKGIGTGLLCGLFLIILLGYNVILGIISYSSELSKSENLVLMFILVLIQSILIGIAEETIFRGIIMNCLYDCFGGNSLKAMYLAVFISSILFGCTHLTNLFKGAELIGVISQIVGATGAGCLLAAIYFRSKNLWVVIFFHSLQDFAGFVQGGMLVGKSATDIVSTYTPLAFIIPVIEVLIALFLLRKKKTLPLLEQEKT